MTMDADVRIAKERFAECTEAMSENRKRMLEDLRFSNPADPQQWDQWAKRDRGDRPMLVFDQSNQYVAQVVNDARQNKPSMKVRPVDDAADVKAAKALNGLLYHIQDASRADIAYDTAIESAARIGLGWLRILPEVVDAQKNEQEIRIKRVHQFDSIVLDDASTEPDGSDAMDGFAITTLSKAAFKKQYPSAATLSFEEGGWFGVDAVRVAEYFKVEEKEISYLTVALPDGTQLDLTEDEYWQMTKQVGSQNVRYLKQWTETKRSVTWTKLSGAEELEETDFPASHVPLVPVIGNELWIEGKRYLCGMVRKGMDAQRAYNYARSTEIELTALQPQSPWLITAAAVEGHEAQWENANSAREAYLTWNSIDADDRPVPQPSRVAPPQFPVAFAQQSQIARDDLQAAFGMYKSNLGAPSNAVSGRAKMQDQREGDTANFHFVDNMRRSVTHLGSIALEMIPAIYDTRRVARILGQDGTPSQVIIDPNAPQAYQADAQGKVTINPAIGRYDVSVSTGPAYATLRQEAAEQMATLFQANPAWAQLLGDLYVKHQDWPYAEEAAQRLKAMLPPQLQAMSQDGQDNPQLAQAMKQVQDLTQKLQQLQGAAQQMDAKLKEKADHAAMDLRIEAYKAETDRLKVVPSAALLQPIILQTLQAILGQATPMAAQVPMGPNMGPSMGQPMGPPTQPLGGPPIGPAAAPLGLPPQQPQGASAPFPLPAQGVQGPIQGPIQ